MDKKSKSRKVATSKEYWYIIPIDSFSVDGRKTKAECIEALETEYNVSEEELQSQYVIIRGVKQVASKGTIKLEDEA